ncbi:jg7908 [Pararge aegeria aegeria]|uniref:Jg7908 protein n=2 Tax=Pararge aegeria TaxID=116150 RepID=A0A8S4QF75_9NEOP|nr:jg7908 [Pararge aegeria aegeria]
MTYASPVFAHLPHRSFSSLQKLQNKFMRMATNCPWFVRNSDLHRDLDLPTIASYFKRLSKSYFKRTESHPNPLVVKACSYTPNPNVDPNRRRPRHVLDDPDDDITTDNAPYARALGLHTDDIVTTTQRLRRRRRGPRFLTSPGRGLNPRPRGRTD